MRCYSGNYPLSHETGKIVSLLEIENWSWSSALLKSSVWKVPVPNELSWLLRCGRLFGRLISVLKWKGSHKCFINVRISSYNFSLKSNQLRPWILETENLSVYRCVLYWIFRLIWAQCNFLSRQTTLNDTQRKNSIQRRQSHLIPNNEMESLKKFKLVGRAWPLRYLCSALWLTD